MNESTPEQSPENPYVVMFVDDDPHIRALFSTILESQGHTVVSAEDGNKALDILMEQKIDLLVTDITMPRLDGFGLIKAVREKGIQLPIIIVTGESRNNDVMNLALSHQADSFLNKPVSANELRFAVKRALESSRNVAEPELPAPKSVPEQKSVAEPPKPVEPERPDNVHYEFPNLIGKAPAIVKIKKLITQVAPSDSNVLILGESGTGKEVIARSIHDHSTRRNKLFVPINCGAIPEELLESELFGHEKGAFTGAITSRKGRFELAEGGTLFLDEIGEMSLQMQVKLLRVLQEMTFERVGSNQTIQADVRIIAATHRNLEEAIIEGTFREDLYYRLNVFPIEAPALRDRPADIPLLIEKFISKHNIAGSPPISFSDSAMDALMQYSWKGNVRELENLLQRMLILYPDSTIEVRDLPPMYRPEGMRNQVDIESSATLPEEGLDLKAHLNDIEYNLICQAMEQNNQVVAHAAEQLGIRRTTLVEKLRKFGLDKSSKSTRF